MPDAMKQNKILVSIQIKWVIKKEMWKEIQSTQILK